MKKIKIGDVTLDNPFLLAPLAGITDAPYRLICKRFGAALVYSEMVSAKGLYYGDKKTDQLLHILEGEGPTAYQIFGSDPEIMGFAARELDSRENVILDVNMGCPVPKVVKNGEGSALLKTPDLIYDIISAMVKNTSKAVTAKIRIGFENSSFLAIEAAKAIEAAGGSAVAVHGRTREQYYSGKADWDKIAQVREAVNIPVIANGDVFSGKDAVELMRTTGCDMVMIGRGALGNPWIFQDCTGALANGTAWEFQGPSLDERKALMVEHLKLMVEEKGEYVATREMRKFIGWYLKGQHGSATLRGMINSLNTVDEMVEAIESFGR